MICLQFNVFINRDIAIFSANNLLMYVLSFLNNTRQALVSDDQWNENIFFLTMESETNECPVTFALKSTFSKKMCCFISAGASSQCY